MDSWISNRLFMTLGCSIVLVAGCASEPKSVVGDDPTTGVGTESVSASSSGSGASSSSGSGGGEVLDGGVYCSQFANRDDCREASTDDVSCTWRELTTYDDACGIVAERSLCLWVPFPGTSDGCVPPLTCGADIYFREAEGGLELTDECGGGMADGFEPCPSSGAEDEPYALPACNCACNEDLPGTGSTGAGSGTSTGG